MKTLTKIVIGALASVGIIAGTLYGGKAQTRKPRDVIALTDFNYQREVEKRRDAGEQFDLDGDGVKDTLQYLAEGIYFRSGAEPRGCYRLIKDGTDLADRLKEWNMLQLDGVGFPSGFEQKGYRF